MKAKMILSSLLMVGLAAWFAVPSAAARPTEDIPEYARATLKCRAGYKAEIRPVGAGPHREVGCRSKDKWDGAAKMFLYADLVRVTYYDAGATKTIVTLHPNGMPKAIRNFDGSGSVTQTLFFKEDGSPDPNGVWGP